MFIFDLGEVTVEKDYRADYCSQGSLSVTFKVTADAE